MLVFLRVSVWFGVVVKAVSETLLQAVGVVLSGPNQWMSLYKSLIGPVCRTEGPEEAQIPRSSS